MPLDVSDDQYYGDLITYSGASIVGTLSAPLRAAIETGWKETYSFLFDTEDRPFVGVLARHHRQAIKWHWAARHRLCRQKQREATVISRLEASNLTLPQKVRALKKYREKQPRYLAYFPIWPRGHMKSTITRRIAVVDAIIELYYGFRGYCLYFSGTDQKTELHAKSINAILTSPKMIRHAPSLSQVKRAEEGGRSLGWKATFFYTAAGYVFHFGSLQSGLAGGNIDDVRPSLLCPDDIDDRKDSPTISENNFKLLTTEILPMGATGTLTIWAQNLISRYSAMYRIHKGHARVLTNRMPSKPIPAIRGMTSEIRTINGIVKDVITGGKPTWKYFGIPECQEEVDRIGLPSFLRELQHEVEQSMEGLMLHNYNDSIHVISESEFESVFGTRKMPEAWPKEWGNDWARTKTARHANVALWRTVSSQRTELPGMTFIFHPMSFKANAQPEDVAERVLSCLTPYANETTEIRGTRVAPVVEKERLLTWAEVRRDELLRINALAHTTEQLERINFERAALIEIIPKYAEPVLRRHSVRGGVNSHEREDIREIYNRVYALKCEGINPGKFGGVEQLNREMMVDLKSAHPFRPDQMGFTRWFVVVPDDTSQQVKVINNIAVYPPEPFPDALRPDELHDDKLFRYQMMNWRVQDAKLTESGERIDEPLKMNDDMGNLMQMLCVGGGLQNIPYTPKEEYEELIAHAKPAPNEAGEIIFTMEDQQKMEMAKWVARENLKEKYGVDDVGELEEDYEEEGSNWWDT